MHYLPNRKRLILRDPNTDEFLFLVSMATEILNEYTTKILKRNIIHIFLNLFSQVDDDEIKEPFSDILISDVKD